MPTAGPVAFGTAADDSAVGTVAWTNVNNAKDDNNVYATFVSSGNAQSHYLKLTAPVSLGIPAGATISGITIDIDRKASLSVSTSENCRDTVVSLLKNSTVTGDNKAVAGTNWPTAEARATYGSATDLWNIAWNSLDFGTGFGVVLSGTIADLAVTGVTASVDYIRVTVDYVSGGQRRRKFNETWLTG